MNDVVISAAWIKDSKLSDKYLLQSLPQFLINDFIEKETPKINSFSIMGRWLLAKQLLQNNLTIDEQFLICRDQHNRPIFPNSPGWHFSISHSGDLVVSILACHLQVGIDIEKKVPLSYDDFRSHYSADEWRFVNDKNDLTRFYSIWTRKEAITKAEGVGIVVDLSKLNTMENPVYFPESEKYWHVNNIDIHEEYVMTVAVSAEIFIPSIIWH